jgi:hypothetical protein
MRVLLLIVLLAATIVIGALMFGWYFARYPQKRRAVAVASALFFGFAIYNPGHEKIVEAREDDEHAKRQKSGDPPKP